MSENFAYEKYIERVLINTANRYLCCIF